MLQAFCHAAVRFTALVAPENHFRVIVIVAQIALDWSPNPFIIFRHGEQASNLDFLLFKMEDHSRILEDVIEEIRR